MSKVLVSILGASNYNKTKYTYNDMSYETPYAVMALLELYFKTNDLINDKFKVYIAGTDDNNRSSKSIHFNTNVNNKVVESDNSTYDNLYFQLKSFFEKQKLNENHFEFVSLPSNQGLPESWETFKVLKDKIKSSLEENDELYIDITNGYRTQPVILLMTVNYLESLFGNQVVKKVFYCKYDQHDNNSGIVDLTDMYFLTKWANAVDTFIHTGQYSHFESLFNKISHHDNQNYCHLRKISNSIKKLSRALRLAKVGFYDFITRNDLEYEDCIAFCVYNLQRDIYTFENSNQSHLINDEYIIIKDLLNRLKNQFKWIQYNPELKKEDILKFLIKDYYKHIYEIILYYRDTEMIQQGLTVLKEIFLIKKSDRKKDSEPNSYLKNLYRLYENVSLKHKSTLNSNLKEYRDFIDHSFYISFSTHDNVKYNLKSSTSDIVHEFNKFVNDNSLKDYAYELNNIHNSAYHQTKHKTVDASILKKVWSSHS